MLRKHCCLPRRTSIPLPQLQSGFSPHRWCSLHLLRFRVSDRRASCFKLLCSTACLALLGLVSRRQGLVVQQRGGCAVACTSAQKYPPALQRGVCMARYGHMRSSASRALDALSRLLGALGNPHKPWLQQKFLCTAPAHVFAGLPCANMPRPGTSGRVAQHLACLWMPASVQSPEVGFMTRLHHYVPSWQDLLPRRLRWQLTSFAESSRARIARPHG